MECLLNAEIDGDESKKSCCIKSFDEINTEKMIRSDWADHSVHSRGEVDIAWQSAHILSTSQFQIVECACHDDAAQAQHRVDALSPMPSCLSIGGRTGGSRHGHARNRSPHSGKVVDDSTAHTSTWHRSTQQTRWARNRYTKTQSRILWLVRKFSRVSDSAFLKIFRHMIESLLRWLSWVCYERRLFWSTVNIYDFLILHNRRQRVFTCFYWMIYSRNLLRARSRQNPRAEIRREHTQTNWESTQLTQEDYWTLHYCWHTLSFFLWRSETIEIYFFPRIPICAFYRTVITKRHTVFASGAKYFFGSIAASSEHGQTRLFLDLSMSFQKRRVRMCSVSDP